MTPTELTPTECERLLAFYTDLLTWHAIPPSPLHEILHEAARLAGWRPHSPAADQRQNKAARARAEQRQQDLAYRRIIVSHLFKRLPKRLRDKHASNATAQAIIKRYEDLNHKSWRPPMTVRTVQRDIQEEGKRQLRVLKKSCREHRLAALGSPHPVISSTEMSFRETRCDDDTLSGSEANPPHSASGRENRTERSHNLETFGVG